MKTTLSGWFVYLPLDDGWKLGSKRYANPGEPAGCFIAIADTGAEFVKVSAQ